jgi:hypothetical protein
MVLCHEITGSAEHYYLRREDKEPCRQTYIDVRGVCLDSRRNVHRLSAYLSSLFIVRQQRLKGS